MYRATLALVILLLVTLIALLETVAQAEMARPGRDLPAGTRGERRQEIKSMDILERPHRPIHVYGNTVRRRASRD